MSLAILGLGTAVPDGTVTQDEALHAARVMGGSALQGATWLPAAYAHSGIRERHQIHGRPVVCDLVNGTRTSGSPFVPAGDGWEPPSTRARMRMYAVEAPPLAMRASAAALREAQTTAAAVTHLVTVSCTGFVAPGIDLALIRGLGLRPTVQRTHVGFMGCHGAVNGLRVAGAFAAADPEAVVLTTAVEVCSLHYYFGAEPDKVIANALFADGAAAVVGRAGGDGCRVAATGSCLIPDSADAMGWTVGDRGFEMTLSRQIPRLIARHLRPWMADWLGGHGLTVETVGSWAIHPGGPKILSAVEEALALPAAVTAVSREVFAGHGNMSSPTVLFILDRLRRENAPRPCVMLGFGPGLVAEAALVL